MMSEDEILNRVVALFPELTVKELLGSGAEGNVYLVVEESTGKELALKVLAKDDKDAIKRFVKEGRLLENFDHPNVVKVYECGERDKTYFHMMEYCAYDSLLYRIAKVDLDDVEAGTLMIKIANSVEYIHSQKVLHRDLKPENIMMTEEGEPKLVDFGLAFCAGEDVTKLPPLGSAGYAPPEIWGHPERVSIQTDVYALGAILYTILTKVLPDPHNVNFNRLFDRDKGYIPLILKSMSSEPSKRYKTAKEFAKSVQSVVDGHGEPPKIW